MVLWIMVVAQMLVWGWFSIAGGKLSDKKFLIFTAGMLLGQIGGGIETYYLGAWRAFAIQVYFFIFTVVGGATRFRQMTQKK